MAPTKADLLQNTSLTTPVAGDKQQSGVDEQQRLEVLKQQKDLQRKEKEQTLWREASRMSNTAEDKPQPAVNPQKVMPHPAKIVTGLFAKLKLGKFLE